jgi:aspartyl-tRNA(Asn)/glutamyl-tRNA(Gln) amidotransferase subunit C
MSQPDKNALKQLIRLCRINCSEDEIESLFTDFQKIIAYIEQLNEVDTTDVPPFEQVRDESFCSLREDRVGDLLKRELLLANAPAHIGGMIKVPPIFKQNKG